MHVIEFLVSGKLDRHPEESTMGKHEAQQTGGKHDSGKTSQPRDEYIGRHRDRTEVVDDAQGWSVGRGVAGDTYER